MGTERDFVVKKGLKVAEDIELGHASDTTIARASAGQITVEGTAVVLAGGANHDGFSDFVANEHIDHSGVSISAGSGLTGGGTIAANRTLTVGAGNGITVNTNDVAVTAAQTTITSVLNTGLVAGRDAHNQIKFSTDDQIIFRVGNADGVIFKASGEIEATKFDGNLEGNADTATSAGTVGVTPNDAAGSFVNENNLIMFLPDGDASSGTGNYRPESSTAFHYNPSTTILTVPKISSAFTGNITGNASGSAGTVTSIGNLTGDVTSSNRATTIANNAVTLAKMAGLARGKIIYGDSNGDPAALALGSNGQVLTTDGTDISWGSAGGGASAIGALDDVLMDATNFTNGFLLQTNSDGSAPTTGTLNSATGNIGIGEDVLANLTSADYNIALGTNSLNDITTGSYNVAIGGWGALQKVTTQTNNIGIGAGAGENITNGSGNVLIGGGAAQGNSGGVAASNNVALGHNAMYAINGVANNNVGIGQYALRDGLTTGDDNIAIGTSAGRNVSTASDLVFIGNESGYANTTGERNIAIGYKAYDAADTENDNIAIGYDALGGAVNGGEKNVVIGNYAGDAITSADNTVLLGYEAGSSITGSTDSIGIGYQAGMTMGNQTIAIGSYSASIGTGWRNVMIGYGAGKRTTDHDNVVIGWEAGDDGTAYGQSVFIGSHAGKRWGIGDKNVAIGYGSGGQQDAASGNDAQYNTVIGHGSGDNVTDGDYNVFLGQSSGDNITTGSNNVVIGAADVPSATGDSQLSISDGDGGVTWIQGNEDGIVLGALTPLFYERAALDTSAVDFRVPTVQSSVANPNGYPMPFAGKVVAASFLFAGSAISTSGNTNTIRIRKNGGSSGSDIKEFTFTEGDLNNTNGNQYTLVKSGSDVSFTFAAGDVIQVKRQSGSTDLNNSQAMLWVSYNF